MLLAFWLWHLRRCYRRGVVRCNGIEYRRMNTPSMDERGIGSPFLFWLLIAFFTFVALLFLGCAVFFSAAYFGFGMERVFGE